MSLSDCPKCPNVQKQSITRTSEAKRLTYGYLFLYKMIKYYTL